MKGLPCSIKIGLCWCVTIDVATIHTKTNMHSKANNTNAASWSNEQVSKDMTILLNVRDAILALLEQARGQKCVFSSLLCFTLFGYSLVLMI